MSAALYPSSFRSKQSNLFYDGTARKRAVSCVWKCCAIWYLDVDVAGLDVSKLLVFVRCCNQGLPNLRFFGIMSGLGTDDKLRFRPHYEKQH